MRASRTAVLASLALAALWLAMAPGAGAAQPQSATLDVEGMVCSGCESTVESLLERTNGVRAAKADRTTETVRIAYDGAATAPSTLAATINDNTYYRASVSGSPAAARPPAPAREAGGFGLAVVLVVLAGAGGLVLAASRVRRRGAGG